MWAEGKVGRGLGPHLGLRWRWRRPWGSRTQGCEQHGPPQDEVPLREGGRQVSGLAVRRASPEVSAETQG